MQPQISPRRGADDGNLEVLLFRHAHRDVTLAESVVDFVVEPALVPELEHVPAIGWQQSEESAETGHVFFQIGRELKKNRPQSVAEHRGVLEQEINEISRLFLEPRVVRDALARLEREGKCLRHLRRPFAQHVLPRQSIEGVVDLHRRKLAGVVAKKSVVLQISRIELSLPLLERVAARPRQNLHDTLRLDSLPSFLGLSFERLAFSASIRSSILVSPPGTTSAVMSCPSILR